MAGRVGVKVERADGSVEFHRARAIVRDNIITIDFGAHLFLKNGDEIQLAYIDEIVIREDR